MSTSRSLAALTLIGIVASCATSAPPSEPVPAAQPSAPPIRAGLRPLPNPVPYPVAWLDAVDNGTRTSTGEPGPRYWEQWTDYTLRARILPDEKRLEGSADIVYHNRSPDALDALHLDLVQNVHAPGAMRNEPLEVTGGVELVRVASAGRDLRELGAGAQGPGFAVIGTRLIVVPERPVAPGASARLTIEWRFTIPQAGASGRMGWDEDNLLFLAYWYPQMTVYDDITGWHPDPFLGTSEFHHGFGSYDLTIDAPAGWIVRATGRHLNPEAVLAPRVRARLQLAGQSDTLVRIVGPADFANATMSGTNGRLEWRFRSDTVRDVAFSVTRESIWEGARTSAGDRNGDGQPDYTRIESLWRGTAPRWQHMVRYEQHAIDFLSRYLGIPYPWPHMTAVEAGGIIGGGMEFPMMTLIGDYDERGDSALYFVTAHELAHMWVPMMVSTDERRYAWLDEGTTTYNENAARMEFYPGLNHFIPDQESYADFALTGMEGEIIRRSNFHYDPNAYGIASYAKPATVLLALRGILGDEVFHRAYRAYLARWKWKHPTPWDFFRSMESLSGRELDWFWRTWYYETWRLDQAIASVTPTAEGTRIVIADRGEAPMPVRLAITLADGSIVGREIPVDVWLRGERRAEITVEGTVTRVEIDPERWFPDVDRGNNAWMR
jgi:hypothetical protein